MRQITGIEGEFDWSEEMESLEQDKQKLSEEYSEWHQTLPDELRDAVTFLQDWNLRWNAQLNRMEQVRGYQMRQLGLRELRRVEQLKEAS